MNEEPHNPSIEPELEARIVALVLGEASDFERDELNRQIEQRPELAAFRSQMQRVHELLGTVTLISRRAIAPVIGSKDTGKTTEASALRLINTTIPTAPLQYADPSEFETPDGNWKLPSDRRNAVLAVIRGEATVQPAVQKVVPSVQLRLPFGPRLLRNLTKVAAVVCIAVAITFYSFSAQERFASEYFYSVAKTDEPRDEISFMGGASLSFQIKPESAAAATEPLSRSSVAKFNLEPLEEELLAQSASGDIDYKRSSDTALSALQNTLNSGAMVSNSVGQLDDVQAIAASPELMVPEETAAQHGISTPGREGRTTATFGDGVESSPAATDPNVFIARNDAAWMDRGLGDADRDVMVDPKPAAPTGGDVAFPMPAEGWGAVNEPAPAPVVRLTVDAPDGDSVLLGAIAAPISGESAEIGGGAEESIPRMIVTNEGEVVGETALGLATSDFSSRIPDQQQELAEQQFPDLNNPDVHFSKDMEGLGFAGNKIDGERLGTETEPMDVLNLARTADDFGLADKNLNGHLSDAGDGFGATSQGNRGFGNGGFGGGGGGGMGGGEDVVVGGRFDLPSSNFSLEMPADANGDTDRISGAISDSGVVDLEKSSGDEARSWSYLGSTKPAEDSAGRQSLESLKEAIAQPSGEVSGAKGFVDGQPDGEPSEPTSQPMALNGEATKSWKSEVADYETEYFEQKDQRGGMLSSDGVAVDNDRDVGFDVNVQDSVRTPTETPDFRSRQMTIPGARTGGAVGIRDNRESESDRSPAPATEKPAAQPELPVIDGFNSADDGTVRNWERDQKLYGRQESDVEGNTHSYFRRFSDVPPTLDYDPEPKKKAAAKTVAPSVGLNETTAAAEAFSTFSLHVSDVSFKLAAAALSKGEWPEAATIRIEEFVNAFDYGDPLPCNGEKVACRVEQSIHPFVQQRNLLRVSMRTAAEGRASNTPLRLTFLLDNSGSMERTDRQQTVRRAFDLLARQLTPIDQVTLIGFARQPRLLADKVSGAESGQLVRLIDELPSEGGTNIEAALQLAFEKAQEQLTPDAQNRIILLTDGAVNLGDADPESLSRMVSTIRDAGIAFDAAGISAEGLNDEVLEALTRKGDGRYYLLDSLESADDGFARQIAGALRPSAKNVKVQIEFNPKRVGSYKLLGFEKHILKQEDFRNDIVDAAEMAAAEAGVAMYQFEAKPDGEGDVGSVSVRFRDLSTGQMIENRWPIPYEADAPRVDQAAPSLRIAVSATLLAAKLRGEPLGETVDLPTLSNLISSLPSQDQSNTRVQQLKLMIEQARQMSGK